MVDIAELNIRVRTDSLSRADAELGKFSRSAQKAEKAAEKLANQAARVGKSLSVGVTLPLLAAASASVKFASDFESELAKINTLVGLSRQEISGFRREILQLAPAVGQGPAELARGLFAITSAGARGESALSALTAAAKASAIGLGDTRDIALAATSAVTAYGEANLSATEAVEILVGTVEQGNLEASELAGVLGRVISIAAEAGVSFRDAGAFIAAFTRQGVDAAQAVTGLRGVLATLVREPTTQAQKAFDQLGISVDDFRQSIRDQGFIDAFGDFVRKADEAGISLATIVPEVEALAGALAVFSSEGTDASEIAGKVGDAVGTLEDRLRAAQELDPALAFAQLRAELETISIEIGSNLLPIAIELASTIRDTSAAFRDLDTSTQKAIIRIAAVAAAAGPALLIFSGLTKATIALSTAIRGASGAVISLIALEKALGATSTASAAAGVSMKGLQLATRGLLVGGTSIVALGLAANTAVAFFRALGMVVDDVKENFSGAADQAERFLGVIERGTFSLPDSPIASDLERISNLDLEGANAELAKLERTLRTIQRQGASEEVIGPLEQEIQAVKNRIDELNSSAQKTPQVIDEIGESSGDAVNEIADLSDAMADLAAQLRGPLAQAQREFQTGAQAIGEAFRTQQITGEEAAELLALLEQRFQSTSDEIGQGMARELERLAFDTLPPVIRQMLGLADATGQVAANSGALSQIGNNFAQAVLQGQGLRAALGSSLTAFGGQGIGNALDQTDLAGFVKTAFTDGIGAAFEDSEFQKNSAAGFALALGQAVDGNIGQAAFTAIGNALGGEIGALIGSIIGDLVFGESVPKFQVRGVNSNTATDAGTDRVINTAFGADLEIAFRGIEDTAKRQIVRGYSEFLSALSGVVRDPGQQSAIADVISRFGVSSRSGPDDLEGQLELLFDDILGTFDSFTQGFVRQAETLDGQVQRLDDILRLQNLDTLGRNFGLTFEELATVLDEVAIGGESIVETFARLEPVINSLDRAADLAGISFAESREGLARFSADLLSFFGDDAGRFTGILNRVLEAAFTEEELEQQTISAARQKASNLLSSLGIAISEETFTQEGLRDLVENFLPGLGPEQTAILLTALDSIVDVIDAEERLADVRGESVDQLARQWESVTRSISDALDQQLLGATSSLTPPQRLDEARSQLLEAVSRAQGGDIEAGRDIAPLFNAVSQLAAQFFGTSTQGFADFLNPIRDLLGGLELGGFSVAEQSLSVQIQQVELLEQISSKIGPDVIQPSTPVARSERPQLVAEIKSLKEELARLNAKTDTANEDRRTAAEAQVDEIGLTREQLALLRRDTDTSLRPRIIRQSLR